MDAFKGIDDLIIRDAINWIVIISSGEATQAEKQQFEDWLQMSIEHQQAYNKVQGAVAGILGTNEQTFSNRMAIRQALLHPVRRRQMLSGMAILLGVSIISGSVINYQYPILDLFTDSRTGTGERNTLEFEDGSRIILNARSSVNVTIENDFRTIALNRGEVYVSQSSSPSYPLKLTCAYGELRSKGHHIGTRLMDNGLKISALEDDSILTTHNREFSVPAGRVGYYDGSSMFLLSEDARANNAWVDGLLNVDDQPLSSIIASLRDYFVGVIQLSEKVGNIHVSGIYSLDDIDATMTSLAETLPVNIRIITRHWISINPLL